MACDWISIPSPVPRMDACMRTSVTIVVFQQYSVNVCTSRFNGRTARFSSTCNERLKG